MICAMQVVASLEKHPDLTKDPPAVLKDAFVKTNAALMVTQINYMTSGCTCVTAYINGTKLFVANAGDSRAVLAVQVGDSLTAENLSKDHKPVRPTPM